MMKKIITISTAVALFGAALLFVGCTKDYGQDLTDVKKDVEELQTSVATANKNIETLQSQVKVLEQAKTDLEAADKNLQSQITTLSNNKADKTELATAKAELEKADAALQKQITSIESTLKDVQTTLALKADKSWVEKTFATVEALNKVSNELGTLTGTVSDINVRLSKVEILVEGLGGDVKDLLERLGKVESRLTDVESRITQAEKDIVSLGNELHTLYYKKGEVDALLANQDKAIRAALLDSAFNIRASIAVLNQKFVTEVKERVAADEQLQKNIKAEETARIAIDILHKNLIDSLSTEMTNEKNYRQTVDDSLYLALCGERIARAVKDGQLQNAIDQEIADRIQAIKDEQKAREDADDKLQNAINQEIADRIQALKDEKAAREKADQESADTLNAKIVKEIAARIQALKDEQKAREDADDKLQNAINQEVADRIQALKDEADAREKADKESADSLNAKIVKEVTDRIQALKDEADAREKEDGNLDKAIKQEITDRKADVKDLQEQIDLIVGGIEGETLKKLRADIDKNTEDIAKINGELAKLSGKLLEMMGFVKEGFDALSSRVASISVCPTLNEELVTFTLGSNDMKMLRASFAVAPVDAVDNMIANKDSLTLIYAEGIARGNTKSNVIYKKAKILKVIKDKPYGTLTVIADSVFTSTPTKAMPTAVYFALAWGDYDAAGKARICSDFAQAIEYNGAFDLLKGFKYAYNKDTVNIKFVPKDDFVNESTRDFVQADTNIIAPFKDKMVAYDNSGASPLEKLFLLDDYYTLYKLGRILNHTFIDTYSCEKEEYPVKQQGNDFSSKFFFNAEAGKKMRDYVRNNPYAIKFQAKVDEHYLIDAQEEKSYLTHNAYITPVDKGTYDLGTVNIDWNYETYKAEDRKVEIAPETKEWKAAKDAKCKVMKKLGNSDLLDYNDWNDNDSTKCYDPIKLSLNGNEYEGDPFEAVKDTVYKQCDTVKYAFAFETTADTPQKDITVYDIQTIPGSLTLAREIIVKDFYKIILAKNPDAAKTPAKDIYIHGAKDTTYASVLKAAQAKIEAKNCVLTVDDSTNIKKFTYEYNSSKDEMKFNIIAGEWGYSADHTITFYVADVFGFKYETIVKVKTGDPKFGLGTKNWIVKTDKGLVGTARGAIVGGVYTLEDMYYNKQVEVVNLDSLTKYETVAEGDLIVKFDTVTLKTLYPKADGKIGVAAGKSGVTVNPKDGSLSSDILTWGDYNGSMFKLKAQLYLKKEKVGEPLEYYICTDKPVRYVSNNDINKQRTPKVDLPIKLYENAVVYGVVDGKEVEQNIVKPDGTISKYVNTEFEYADPKDWKVTLNGSTPTSWIENVDYKYDTDKQILTIMGDNLKGELKIVIGTKLHYYLDANVPEEKDLTINISQN